MNKRYTTVGTSSYNNHITYFQMLFKRTAWLALLLALTLTAQTNAQSVGDYRSTVAVFNWTATGNWERWDGTTWVLNPPQGYPGQSSGTGTVTIRNGATVTINVTPANAIGGLVVGEGTSGTLAFNNAGQTLNIGAGGVLVNAGGTFRVAVPANPNNNTHTINITGGGSFTNNGTVNFREVSGGNTDVANLNLSGNLAGTGTSTFNDIIFNGTSNQTITIGGTINNIQAIIYNNTGTAPNNQITNQSTTFTAAINPGTSTFTAGNYRHDNTGTYLVSNGSITVAAAMTVTALQGTMNFAHDNASAPVLTLNGRLVIDGGIVNAGVNTNTTSEFANALNMNAANANITLNSGQLNVGNTTTGFGNLRMSVDNLSVTVNNGTLRTERWVIGSGNTDNHTVTINGGLVRILPTVTTTNRVALQFVQGTLVMNGGELRIGENLTAITGSNLVQLATAGAPDQPTTFTINNGVCIVAGNPSFTSVAAVNPFNLGGAGTANVTLNIGNGVGGANTAVLEILPNLAPITPTPVTRNILDMDANAPDINVININSDARLKVGGGNIGNFRLNGNNCTVNMNGGTVDVTASVQLASGAEFFVAGGTLNVGVDLSNGVNSVIFPADVGAVTRFVVSGGTVNVGDGNSSFGSLTATGNFGNGNNNPAFASANYASLEITGGTLNLNGRFTLNDANYRFIMSGGAFNIDPTGDQDITGTQNALSFTRGIVQHSGGTITIVNPNPNAGGTNTTTGVSFRTSPVGDPATGANLTGSTTTPNVDACFTGTSVIRFGDGVSTTSGSVEGFEVCLDPSHTYNNFVVNNPSGSNRFVWLYTPTNNQTLNFNGNFTLTVGEVSQGRPVTPVVPNVLVQGIGSGVFTLGNTALYRIYNVATGNPAPIYGLAANYSIDFNSTIEYMSDVASGQTVSLPTGVEFGNLTISGTGTRNVTVGNAVRNTLTLNQGVLNVGTGNLTMRNNSRLVRAGTNTSGILQAGNTLGQAAGDLFRIIYRGVSKNFLDEEFTGAGNKSLEVDLNVGETVTQNVNRTIVDLFLTQGTLNDGGNTLSVTGNISGNATHTSTGSGRIQLTGTGAQTISNAPTLGNFRLNKSSGSSSVAAGASPTITGVFDIVQDDGANSGILDIGDNRLSFGLNASTAGTFNANRKIRLSGLLTALGVRKNFQGGQTFAFPIGVGTRYTPARLSITTATGTDFITVTPIAQEAPTNSAALALQYYWRVEVGTNITVTNISHSYQYENSDVENVPADAAIYQAGRFNTSTAQWTALTINEVDENLDLDGNPLATGGRIRFPNVSYADGLFTAGEGAKFNNGTVVPYYSLANATGDWTVPASWRTDGHTGSNVPSGPPGFDNPVFIDQNSVIFLNTTLVQAVPSVTIGPTGRLRLDVNPGSVSFGTVSGTGTLELRDDDNNGIQFPVGAFTSFLGVTGGTVEYGGAQNYTLPTAPTGYRNLVISGNATTKTFPAQELTLSGNLTVQGGATALLSNAADGDIIITGDAVGGGNLTITGTGSTLRFTNGNERLVEVRRNVTIGAGATFDVATTGTPIENLLVIGDNASALGGNLVNNGTFDMNAGGGRIANVVFRGTGNATITGTGGTTEFYRLIVNKGTNQTATLTVPDVATLASFALTAPANTSFKPLAIQNGTFVFNRPTATLELSSGGGNFTIPTTGALQVGGGTVQLSSTGGHDLILNGRLRITGGTVNIGTDVSGVSQNSIIYQSASAELLVEGGTLTVATGIRANGGILNYTQSDGTVTVGRYSTEDGFPIFGIVTGGQFNMTGPNAVLDIVRGRNSANTIADLLIENVSSPTAPQGTIQIFTSDTPINAITTPPPAQLGFIYDINSNVRLPNVNIGVGQAVNYNVGARNGAGPQTLDIRGNLTINTTGSCQVRLWRINGNTAQDEQSITIGGNFTLTSGTIVMANTSTFNVRGNFVQNGGNFNQGTTPNANLLVGGNFTLAGGTFNTFVNTTFNGNTTPQVITRTGGSPTTLTFQNFTINNTATGGTIQLGAGTDLIITGNWTTTAGAFDAQTNARTVTFSGTTAQTITGTTDFYNLTINNGAGVTFASGTLGIRTTPGSGGTLTLQNGILNIGNNPLIIRNTDAVGVIGGTPSASAMISTSGTAAAAGVTKVYGGAQSFTFPIGTASPFAIYTPATINVTNLGTGSAGSITVAPVRAAHPQTITATGRINYYWRTTQTGFAEESTGFSVTHTYVATTAVGNVGGSLPNYVGAYYIGSPAFQWNFLPVPPNTPNPATFDEGTFTIGAPTPGTTNRITGDFTAGEGLLNPTVFYSVRNGNWDVVTGVGTTTWSTDPVTETPPNVLPNAGNPVVIRNGHVVNTNGNGRTSASLTFATGGGTLVISSASTGHNFGTVSSSGGGAGTIRFDQNVAAAPTFPTATLDPSFLANGTIEYSGTGSYTLPTTGVPNPYPNLTFSGSGTKTLPTGATNVSLNLTLSGSVTVAMGTNTMNRTSVGGTMTMGLGTTLTLTGANDFPANYGTYSLATTSTVDYTANANQTIAAVTYGNLTLTITPGAGTVTKTLAGATTVAGNLLVRRTGGGGNLTFATNNHNLTVGGNFTLNNDLPVTEFSGGTSTVTFNGTGAQIITRTGGGTLTFNNMTVNKSSGTLTLANTAPNGTTLSVPGTLTLTSGAFTIGGSIIVSNTLALGGTVSGSGTITGSINSNMSITGTGALGTLNFTTGGQTLRRLTVNRAGSSPTVTLGTNLTVGQGIGGLDSLYLFNGIIQTGTNVLTLANPDQFGHGSPSAFVDGILRMTYPNATEARFFPIAGDGIYRPVSVSGTATAGTQVTVRMINTAPSGTPGAGLNNLSGVRYYQIERSGTFSGTPRVQLSINTVAPVDEFASNPGGLTVASTTDNPPTGSTVWQAGGNPAAAFTPFPAAIMSADITSLSSSSPVFVTAASTVPNDNPLPVELVSFAITAVDEGVKLKWETASEVDNAGFIVSRSRFRDGGFEELASYRTHDALVGKGTSATGGKYEWIDKSKLLPGETYYYKLEDVDFNGVIHTVEVKEFTMPKEYSLSQNYPNPFNPSTVIEFNLRLPGRTVLEVYNVLGQRVMTVVDGELSAGSYRYQVNLTGMASGMYLYRLRSRDFVATKKMMLIK